RMRAGLGDGRSGGRVADGGGALGLGRGAGAVLDALQVRLDARGVGRLARDVLLLVGAAGGGVGDQALAVGPGPGRLGRGARFGVLEVLLGGRVGGGIEL